MLNLVHLLAPCGLVQAVRKLTYLQMMGYDMSWASFSVVEVMSSSRFAHKRIGYLAACQTFTDTTDVVLLTTNLLKKEFLSPNQYEVRQGGKGPMEGIIHKGRDTTWRRCLMRPGCCCCGGWVVVLVVSVLRWASR